MSNYKITADYVSDDGGGVHFVCFTISLVIGTKTMFEYSSGARFTKRALIDKVDSCKACTLYGKCDDTDFEYKLQFSACDEESGQLTAEDWDSAPACINILFTRADRKELANAVSRAINQV